MTKYTIPSRILFVTSHNAAVGSYFTKKDEMKKCEERARL